MQPKPSGCALTTRQNEIASEVTGRYGSYDNILNVFAPMHQRRYAANEYRCFFGLAPRLSHMRFTYGESAPIEWLSYQIIDLNRFANCRSMTDHQVNELAYIIAKDYYFLKLTEVMLFFHKLKSGEYGKIFYSAVDPMDILTALRKFAEERVEIVRKQEDDEARAEREREAHRPGILKPHEVQALRERLQAKWAEEEKLNQKKITKND